MLIRSQNKAITTSTTQTNRKEQRYADKEQETERLRNSGRGHRKTEYDVKKLPGRVRIPAFQCRLVSLPEKYGDSGYGY